MLIKHHRSLPYLLLGWMALLSAGLLEAQPEPLWVEIEPNAIQTDLETPLSIEVHGAEGQKAVWLEVLRDCDGDGQPDRRRAGCESPLYQRHSTAASANNIIVDRLDFKRLAAEGTHLPQNEGLWLRVARDPDTDECTLARFGIVTDPCNLFRSLIATFLGGRCASDITGSLPRHRGMGMPDETLFEVRRLTVSSCVEEAPAAPTVVAGSRGATGVAWLDKKHLLVTLAGPVAAKEATAGKGGILPKGLYRFAAGKGESDLLWPAPPDDDRAPAAPLPLPGGAVAFVHQPLRGEIGPGGKRVEVYLLQGKEARPVAQLPEPRVRAPGGGCGPPALAAAHRSLRRRPSRRWPAGHPSPRPVARAPLRGPHRPHEWPAALRALAGQRGAFRLRAGHRPRAPPTAAAI